MSIVYLTAFVCACALQGTQIVVAGHFRYHTNALLNFVGGILMTAGVLFAALVTLRLLNDLTRDQIERNVALAMVPASPALMLAQPTATPLAQAIAALAVAVRPTPMPTPTSVAAPMLSPVVRLSIPAIKLNAKVTESRLTPWQNRSGQFGLRWADPGYAVGHLEGTGVPGQGINMVFTGHNNWRGQVFRRLPELKRGDELVLFTETGEHHYRVVLRWIVPYRRAPARGETLLGMYLRPFAADRVTLISCYPYLTNADRIVVIAAPVIDVTSALQGDGL